MLHRLLTIPSGESGTDATVAKIIQGVQASLRHPATRLLALNILNRSGVPDRDTRAQVEALYQWIAKNIRYLRDPLGVELVQRPEVTVKLRAGDCDDHSGLLGALAASLGLPVRFRVIGRDADNFRHIYPEVDISGEWLPADTTARRSVGFRPVSHGAEKVYTLTSEGKSMAEITAIRGRPRRVQRSQLEQAISANVRQTLRDNWSSGRIDHNDLDSYLRVIAEKNAPFSGTAWIEAPVRTAIQDFKKYVQASGMPSYKPAGTLSGLEGLDGFLKSIWSGVKSVVKGAVNLVTGGGKQTVEIKTSPAPAPTTTTAPAPAVTIKTPTTTYTAPVVTQPVVQPYIAPEPSTMDSLLKSPLVWVGVGLVALLVLMPRGRG